MTETNGPRFNLIDEPWILTRDLAGEVRQLSLAQIFEQAPRTRDVVGEVPTQTFAIVRVMLAVLHRAILGAEPERLGDEDAASDLWAELWRAPELPLEDIGRYLDQVRDRFDLLDPVAPFMQVADLRTAKGEMSGLEKLIADVPNGEPFFTTRSGAALERIPFAEAARWLVHCQAFDPSGIKSGAVGDPRVKGGKGYPIGTAWAGALGGVLLDGGDLRRTLLLNLVLVDQDGAVVTGGDLPLWERPPLTAQEQGRSPQGPVDLFTWPSRRIRLGHDGRAVTSVLICNGDKLDQADRFDEPMTQWRRSPTQEKARRSSTPVYMPRTHDPERAMWRGLAALLVRAGSRSSLRDAPSFWPVGVIDWVDRLQGEEILDPGIEIRTRAVGMRYGTQSATAEEIVDDHLTMHAVLLSRRGETLAAEALAAVESTDGAVLALANLAGNLAAAAGGEGDGERNRAREQAYYRLDAPFRQWLAELVEDSDLLEERYGWHRTARRIVQEIGRDLVDGAGPAAWVGRENSRGRHVCTPLAEAWFLAALRKALPLPDDRPPTGGKRAGETPGPEVASAVGPTDPAARKDS